MKVRSYNSAWSVVTNLMCGSLFIKDEDASKRAGYPIYRDTLEYYNYVCDLNDRLELNRKDSDTINIWIRPEVFSKYDLQEAADFLGDTLYTLEDKVSSRLCKEVGLDPIHKALSNVWDALARVADEDLSPEEATEFKKRYCLE